MPSAKALDAKPRHVPENCQEPCTRASPPPVPKLGTPNSVPHLSGSPPTPCISHRPQTWLPSNGNPIPTPPPPPPAARGPPGEDSILGVRQYPGRTLNLSPGGKFINRESELFGGYSINQDLTEIQDSGWGGSLISRLHILGSGEGFQTLPPPCHPVACSPRLRSHSLRL